MQKYLPAIAAATTGVFVGATIVATRFVIAQTPSAALALLQYVVSFRHFSYRHASALRPVISY